MLGFWRASEEVAFSRYSMKRKCILLTGATGFLGSHILKSFLFESDSKVFLLVRSNSKQHAEKRLLFLLENMLGVRFRNFYSRRIECISGDQTKEDLGVSIIGYRRLIKSVSEIYHCAAATDFRMSLAAARDTNVNGLRNVLQLADNCGLLSKFNYISIKYDI